jgi:hypothetical protein
MPKIIDNSLAFPLLKLRLILAKVLEGRSCVGRPEMREPPKDAAGVRFDSTRDAQRYP